MEKVKRTVWAWAAFALVLLTLSLSLYVLGQERQELFYNTFSSIGERYRAWFLLFSVCLSLTLLVNVKILAAKLRFTKRIIIMLGAFLFFNMPLALAQALIIDPVVGTEHLYLAIAFTAHSLMAVLIVIFLILSIKGKKWLVQMACYLSLLVVAGMLNLYILLEAHGIVIAFYQLVLVWTTIAVIFCMQHYEQYGHG